MEVSGASWSSVGNEGEQLFSVMLMVTGVIACLLASLAISSFSSLLSACLPPRGASGRCWRSCGCWPTHLKQEYSLSFSSASTGGCGRACTTSERASEHTHDGPQRAPGRPSSRSCRPTNLNVELSLQHHLRAPAERAGSSSSPPARSPQFVASLAPRLKHVKVSKGD